MGVEALPRPTQSQETVPPSPERERVAEFAEVLSTIDTHVVLDTPLHLEISDAIHDAATYFLNAERLPSNAIYLHKDFAHVSESKQPPTFIAMKSRGGTRSAHGVFFGAMVFESGETVPVAVKPHDDDPARSSTVDYYANVAAKDMQLETLQPVGMIHTSNGKAYSLTQLERALTTLDSVDWRKALAEGDDEMLATWSQAARLTAMLHARGSSSHGDLAPRNLAQRPDGSGVFMIDWERARLSTAQPRDAEARYAHSRIDVGEVLESFVRHPQDFKGGIGLLTDHPDPWKAFEDIFFNEYVGMRLDAASPAELRDVQDELIELESSLKRQVLPAILNQPKYREIRAHL